MGFCFVLWGGVLLLRFVFFLEFIVRPAGRWHVDVGGNAIWIFVVISVLCVLIFLDGSKGGLFCYLILRRANFSFFENSVFYLSSSPCVIGGFFTVVGYVFVSVVMGPLGFGGCSTFIGFVGGVWWVCRGFYISLGAIVIPFLSSSVSSAALCFIAKYNHSVF